MTSNQDVQEDLIHAILDSTETIAKILMRQNSTIMVAESATGGLIQHFLTEIPGSSSFFLGGVVAYSDDLKQGLLQVPESVIQRHGAVSEETVAAMANGIRLLLRTDYGLATSGIAGPTGARPKKPVGLVHIAVSHRGFETITRSLVFKGTRTENKLHFCKAALQFLLEAISSED
jgi:PncC family amidohydrolase